MCGSTYTTVIETPEDLDNLTALFDGSASLVKGSASRSFGRRWVGGQKPAPPVYKPDGKPPTGNIADGDAGWAGHPATPKRHKNIQITIDGLKIGKTNNLQSYLFKVLQEQDAVADLTLTIQVNSAAGVSAEPLDKRIVDGLEQLGVTVK